MQIIRVDVISSAVKHLQARYQFESAQIINRWLTMKLVNAVIAGKEDLSEILDEIIPDLPPTHALAGKDEPKDFDDLRSDIQRACELIMEKLDNFMEHLDIGIIAMELDDEVQPEVWIAYHEIDDSTYAVSLRDNRTTLVELMPIDVASLHATEVVHVVDGRVIMADRIIEADGTVNMIEPE